MVTLRPGVEAELEDALRRLPGVDVVGDAPQTTIIVKGSSFPVQTRVIRAEDINGLFDSDFSNFLVLIRASLDDATAARLEDTNIGFVDAVGRSWFPGQPRTKNVNVLQTNTQRSLRAPSLRLAQLLADYPNEYWSERTLARRGATSRLTANRLLGRLEREGLLERQGSGRSTTRHVSNLPQLWHWIADNGRPNRVTRLSCFVPELGEIPNSISGFPLVLTGALASEQLGTPVLVGAQWPTYRIATDAAGLEEIPHALGGFRTTRGANLTLIADLDHLGDRDSRQTAEGKPIAPPSRVMLDLYLEPRGKAAVELFCDLWLSHNIT